MAKNSPNPTHRAANRLKNTFHPWRVYAAQKPMTMTRSMGMAMKKPTEDGSNSAPHTCPATRLAMGPNLASAASGSAPLLIHAAADHRPLPAPVSMPVRFAWMLLTQDRGFQLPSIPSLRLVRLPAWLAHRNTGRQSSPWPQAGAGPPGAPGIASGSAASVVICENRVDVRSPAAVVISSSQPIRHS